MGSRLGIRRSAAVMQDVQHQDSAGESLHHWRKPQHIATNQWDQHVVRLAIVAAREVGLSPIEVLDAMELMDEVKVRQLVRGLEALEITMIESMERSILYDRGLVKQISVCEGEEDEDSWRVAEEEEVKKEEKEEEEPHHAYDVWNLTTMRQQRKETTNKVAPACSARCYVCLEPTTTRGTCVCKAPIHSACLAICLAQMTHECCSVCKSKYGVTYNAEM